MRLALVAVTLVACGAAPPPKPAPAPAPPAPAIPNDPAHQTPRQRIEGTWSFEKWFLGQKWVEAPELGGIYSMRDGIMLFELNLHAQHAYIFCIGWYKFSANDTVVSMGWNRCSKWSMQPDGGVHTDFEDEWDNMKPEMKIETLPNGDLSLKYNTNNEHPHEVKHGAIGMDYTFKLDETIEYWNQRKIDGKKDNIKYFKKLHEGDPSKHF